MTPCRRPDEWAEKILDFVPAPGLPPEIRQASYDFPNAKKFLGFGFARVNRRRRDQGLQRRALFAGVGSYPLRAAEPP